MRACKKQRGQGSEEGRPEGEEADGRKEARPSRRNNNPPPTTHSPTDSVHILNRRPREQCRAPLFLQSYFNPSEGSDLIEFRQRD